MTSKTDLEGFKNNLLLFLDSMDKHYRSLSSYMDEEGEERRAKEHRGRAKFAEYLAYKIRRGEFNPK
jgi:hypothetical protein